MKNKTRGSSKSFVLLLIFASVAILGHIAYLSFIKPVSVNKIVTLPNGCYYRESRCKLGESCNEDPVLICPTPTPTPTPTPPTKPTPTSTPITRPLFFNAKNPCGVSSYSTITYSCESNGSPTDLTRGGCIDIMEAMNTVQIKCNNVRGVK